ncbi:MAG: NADH-quinone oxidoreductase subunit N [Ilumatobacteraceae bacterium]|nr:NADH-quinone oxidoreductase subunit N [Ilumatobacteraceae bacterium]MDP4935846.1 NADH-quinone oxidoreductase subunit N [Ilumatobacteraceae bacterium]MDP4977521.1 NADH-quinone oxidoreductase subunit N [Ilumatobacteraceae bacterium]MDP5114044.1 NADH-quinone oxidoreductase subunit N [Ilumatobacteraceae bacterium]
MLSSILAQIPWQAPTIDYHAIAPEIVLAAGICLIILVDLFVSESKKWVTSTLTGFVMLTALVPVLTLAVSDNNVRSLFDGRYVIDEFALTVKALFLIAGYVVILMSQNHVEEGDYYLGEYFTLLLTSVTGMVMMASSRDLVSIFVALEMLSIPAYMLAAWRKRDRKSNEAGVKYYLLGVFASAIMLYGMSLLYGVTGTTLLSDIGRQLTVEGQFGGVQALAITFVIVGFAFKVSAVPFHTWAPDTYEGAPIPVTAFLSVASKAAGFVALVTLIYVGFPQAKDVWQPFLWVLAAITMTVGNLVALRQTNIVRMLAYSSISQGGFILMPLAVAGTGDAAGPALQSVVVYLIVYAAMNLGMFAVVIAASRTTRSGEISSFGGLFSYAPGLGVLMTIFLASLAGIPPLGGWIAKFTAFRAVLEAGGGWGYGIAVIGAINSVIAFGYYGSIMREIWMKPAPNGETSAVKTPSSLIAAMVITTAGTIVFGVLPGVVLRFGDLADLTGAFGR